MTISTNFVPGRHSRYWEKKTNLSVASAAGAFTVADNKELSGRVLIVNSATVQYLYDCKKEHVFQLPSFALAGVFGAGSTGTCRQWSNTLTATTGGTNSQIVIATNINNYAIGEDVIFRTGANAGAVKKVINIIANPAGGTTLYLESALDNVVSNGDTFQVSSGLFIILCSYATLAAGVLKSFDPLTGVVNTLTQTGLPAAWGTDGRLISPSSEDVYATGTVTSATGTTLVCSTKTWNVDKWINYQARIKSGTGSGQVRRITDSDATSLTIASAWTVTPDATSVFVIEDDENALYLLGNNAVTMYKYTFTSDTVGTWATLAPTTARSVAPGVGMSANLCHLTGNSDYDNENTGQAGRWIYSFRGGATGTLQAFDITGGTAGAGAWRDVTIPNSFEVFGSGSAYAMFKDKIVVRKDATHRYFLYDFTRNTISAFTLNQYPDGAAVTGDKMWVFNVVDDSGTVKLTYIYTWRNTGVEIFRTIYF